MFTLPPNSLIHGSLPRMDYADSYSAPVFGDVAKDVELAARSFLSWNPRWIVFLVWLRNAIVRMFGLKTDYSQAAKEAKLPFAILKQTPNELLLGESDKHLSFTLSLLIEEDKYSHWLVVTTAVMYHNWFGKLYFFFVKPFHRLIVRTSLGHMARSCKPPQDM